MTNGYSWLAREKTNPHQSKTDPSQPVLACLTVSVEECPDALKQRDSSIHDIFFHKHMFSPKVCGCYLASISKWSLIYKTVWLILSANITEIDGMICSISQE